MTSRKTGGLGKWRLVTRVGGLVVGGVALSACGGGRPQTPQQVCAAQANNDPVVQDLILKGLSNPYFQDKSQDEIAAARAHATDDCLRRRGLLPLGGVEPPDRQPTVFQ